MVKFFWSIIKPYKLHYLLMILACPIHSFYPVIWNYALKVSIDMFTKFEYISWHDAAYPIGLFILSQLVLDLPWRIHNWAQWKVVPETRRDYTVKINEYIYNHSYQFFQNTFSGSVVSKIKGISDGWYKIWGDVEAKVAGPLFKSIFCGSALAFANIKIFLITLLFLSFYLPIGYYYFIIKLRAADKLAIDDWHSIVGKISDNITNIFGVFSFAAKKRELKRLEDHYNNVHIKLAKNSYWIDLIGSWISTIFYWIFIIGTITMLIKLRNDGEISIGDIAFIMSLTWTFSDQMWNLMTNFKDAIRHYTDLKSSFSIMEIPNDEIDKPNSPEIKITKGKIIFRDLSFGYGDNKIFNELNLEIESGQKIGLVGHSGAGKSTLISLLLKNFKATNGNIIIDNQSIYDFSSDSLRSQISLIPQDIMLFHRSIGENIGYAKENATQIEIENAAKMANIHEFINKLEKGYNTLVGERGIKLSGGQRQRIAIARAILKNSSILILDEATSALDSETEQEIQKSNNSILQQNNTTVIAIAHRLSTIKHMDRIIVMEDGKIIEDGSFEELTNQQSSKFKELWDHQVNGMVV